MKKVININSTGAGRLWLVLLVPIFLVCSAATVMAVPTLTVTGVDKDGSLPPVTNYRWMIEEDATYHVQRDASGQVQLDGDGFPVIDPNWHHKDTLGNPYPLSLSFHRSYVPVVAKGDDATAFPPACTDPVTVSPCLNPAKHYFVSVLPKDAGTYSIGGAAFKPDDTNVTVYLNQNPIPTAQITIFIFKDTQPINSAPDATEPGLAGFQIKVEDAGGRYGASAGEQLFDAFGNPLGTQYDAAGNPNGFEPLVTDATGLITIKNLAPGKYGILASPPAGSNWQQTSTIEGTKVIDAWVKANEPPFFAEFGPPGYHVFIGFVEPFNDIPAGGTASITGSVVNNHLSRPPYAGGAFNLGGPLTHTTPWVGLNDNAGLAAVSNGIYAARTDDGGFSIPNVPPGDYQLTVWDDNLDVVFAFQGITVNPDGTCSPDCELGDIGVFQWFTRLEHHVFNDLDGNGLWNPGETGLASQPPILEQAVNLRWRDGTLYQSFPTDGDGFAPFDQVFPFFSWLTAEVDFARFKATGVMVVVDDGGPIPQDPPASYWTFGGQLTPQVQGNPEDPDSWWPMAPNTDLYRIERGPALVEGFQGFLGQTSVMIWGKKAYEFSETGGVSGVVYYATTRAEDDPRLAAVEPWEPGIPRVQVNLYQSDGAGNILDQDVSPNGIQLADVDNYPFDWSAGGAMGPEDFENSDPPNATFDQNDAIQVTWTDSWDDSLPANCQYGVNAGSGTDDPYVFRGQATDCYDGMRNWNQVRPGVFDGGYAFGPEYSIAEDFPGGTPSWITIPDPANPDTGVMKPGFYIVEVKTPPGYEIVKEEDRNVDFGDEFIPSPLLLPPECVGDDHPVPAELTLFPGEPVGSGFGLTNRPLCDRKQVFLNPAQNAAADFFLFTEVPIAGHIVGGILDDTANEFDPASPQFGEKFAPPFMPISIQDWTGREITRTYSDEYGRFNALVPSTYTNNLPQPSGMSPNMLTTCMNHPRKPDPADPGMFIDDPLFNPQYSTFCYTFQYMPGATTYLDTPVVPSAAFAGPDQAPLDCEFPDGTPRISMATVNNGVGGGPFIPHTFGGQTIEITSMGSVSVPNPIYDGVGGTEPTTITRDYGFGPADPDNQVTLGGVMLGVTDWTNATITATIPAGLDAGGQQLMVTRGDNNQTTITGLTVQVGLRPGSNVVQVTPGPPNASGLGPIQQAIDAAGFNDGINDLILVGPGNYEEMVIMHKPVQLQGWGPGVVTINAINTPMEKLEFWRQKLRQLVEDLEVDLLPGQEQAFGGVEPGTLFTEEGAGVLVLAKATGPNRFARNQSTWVNRGARIDGFTIRGASTGGGIIANGYAKFMDIGNNIILNNSGFYAGGVRLGHPELTTIDPDTQLEIHTDADNDNVRIHHNQITQNGGLGGAGGGVSLCTGSTRYNVSANWICGNFTLGDGAGIGHFGESNNGLIADNKILFNEQFNQGLTVSGGGIFVGGKLPLEANTLSPGTGNVNIFRNLIQSNSAGVGDGGGIRLSRVNGQDVSGAPGSWKAVNIYSNMIVNNVAALAGGGISLQDVAKARIRFNVVANNDSTATSGNAIDLATFTSTPQPAGIVARAHSQDNPAQGLLGLGPAVAAACADAGSTSRFCNPDNPDPVLTENIIWHNRSFYYGETPPTDPPDPAAPPYSLIPAANPYDDLAVLGTAGCLDPRRNILTSRFEDQPQCTYAGNNQDEAGIANPAFVMEYFNGGRGETFLPGEPTTLISTPAAFDEGGNFIRVRFGPLTLCDDATPDDGNPGMCSDYHITGVSTAQNAGPTNVPGALSVDIDNEPRPFDEGNSDWGADELQIP